MARRARLLSADGAGAPGVAVPDCGTGTIEADYLNGEIVLLGRMHGVPTPVNDALQRAANVFAREQRQPGPMPLSELTAPADQMTTQE